MGMPSMSGFQFLNNIKLRKPEVKVLLMSAFEMTGKFSEYSKPYDNKIDGYIQKPVSIRKLNVLVNSCMMSK
jgi:DNA-binding NarL/FixJ family response regulator